MKLLDKDDNILSNKFDSINRISEKSILFNYLNPNVIKLDNKSNKKEFMYPFGTNLSQIQAVTKALNNRLSVIEGPPGTENQYQFNITMHYPMNNYFLTFAQKKYATNKLTHVDFLISNLYDKSPVLAIEVNGVSFHSSDE